MTSKTTRKRTEKPQLDSRQQKALDDAIQKLQEIYQQGDEIRELLELGPTGQHAKHGHVEAAAKVVAKKRNRRIGNERARKSVEFVKAFTIKQFQDLVKKCNEKQFCPEFGTLVRLLPVQKSRERNRLLKQVLDNKWTKADLDAQIELSKPGSSKNDKNRSGRPPKAANSMRALQGQAAVDARSWSRILSALQQPDAAFELTEKQTKDLKDLSKLLRKISKWRG